LEDRLDTHFSKEERQIFEAYIFMVLGDGSSTLDRWLDGQSLQDIAPDLFVLIPRHARKRRMVREALVEHIWITDITGALSSLVLWQYVKLWIWLHDVQLSVEPDMLLWRRMTDDQYSSKSCYNTLFEGALVSSSWKLN
jgi:hypothetical protein